MANRRLLEIHRQAQARRLVLPLSTAALVPLVTRHFHFPDEIFALSKQIDGAPKAYGTFPLAGARAACFLNQRQRQPFYEPLSNSKQILEVLVSNYLLMEGHVPEWSLPHISVAIEVFDSIFTAPRGRVPLPEAGEARRGEHQVSLTGHWENGGEWLQFQNWWGPDWGDQGLGYLSHDYLNRHMVEAWLVRDASVGPSPMIYQRLVNARSETERSMIWLLPNRRWRRRGHRAGYGYELVVYETLSVAEECRVQVIQVRTGYGIRVGWAHLFYLGGDPRTCLLKELFIWPPFRRQGYGTILESVATENARAWGARRLQVLLHEMDAQPSMSAAAESFAEQLSFRWHWDKSTQPPRVEAIGEKML